MASGVIGFSKDMRVLEWIASKKDFDITKVEDSVLVKSLIFQGGSEALQTLQLVSEKGMHLKEDDFFGLPHTPLIDCLVHREITDRQEKFNLLWKMATKEQREFLIDNFKHDDIHIPEEVTENSSSIRNM